MTKTLAELAELVGGSVHGDSNRVVSSVASLHSATDADICFIAQPRYREELRATHAGAVILKKSELAHCPTDAIEVSDPSLAYAKIADLLTRKAHLNKGVHPTAVVGENAQIDPSAYIAAHCVLGANVKVGAHSYIGPNSVIGEDCVVGNHCHFVAQVSVYDKTEIGNSALIHAGAVIGSDGFGFANDEGSWVRIPQLGRVIIGDNVEIGANCTIDRGALNDTILSDGVKLDNLIHIAHNVELGENSALAAQVGIAGSTKIGQQVTIGGQSGVAGHLNITDNVHFTGMAMVTKSIPVSGVYSSGLPAEENRTWRKNVARFRRLDELEKRLKALEAELEQLKG